MSQGLKIRCCQDWSYGDLSVFGPCRTQIVNRLGVVRFHNHKRVPYLKRNRDPPHHIQHFYVRELGTRSETYRGSAFKGSTEPQMLVQRLICSSFVGKTRTTGSSASIKSYGCVNVRLLRLGFELHRRAVWLKWACGEKAEEDVSFFPLALLPFFFFAHRR